MSPTFDTSKCCASCATTSFLILYCYERFSEGFSEGFSLSGAFYRREPNWIECLFKFWLNNDSMLSDGGGISVFNGLELFFGSLALSGVSFDGLVGDIILL